MATCDPRPTDLIARARPTLGDLRDWADQIDGVVGLARETVFLEAGTSEELTRAWCGMDMALEKLKRLRAALEALDDGRAES